MSVDFWRISYIILYTRQFGGNNMDQQLELKAFAKVNLGLDVLRRREDGYHEVSMVMQSIRLFDRLILSINPYGDIRLTSNLSHLPLNENNLVYQAIDIMRKEYGIKDGISVRIEKHIPIAAGLAGGSSDAAAALIGMNQMFSLGIREQRLMELGVTLGADIPFCIMRGTALSQGIGEILTPLPPVPECWLLIVKPSFSMSTRFVYQHLDPKTALHPDIDGMVEAIKRGDLAGMTERMGNSLEQVTAAHFPDIISMKEKMTELGAMNAIMSGSGSTVFGVFDQKDPAVEAAAVFRKEPGIRLAAAVRPYNSIRKRNLKS